MNIAEVLLRLGCALVAWMVVFTHLIWLATLRVTGCTDGDQLWRLLLGFAVVSIGFSFMLTISRKLREVHDILRWFGVPAAILMLLASVPVWQALTDSTLDGAAICGGPPPAAWHPWWAPVQLVVLAAILFNCWRAFKKAL